MCGVALGCVFFFFKQKTAYEMRISDWSSDVCSSDLLGLGWGGLKKLRSLRPDMTVAERTAVHRHNLGVIMLARPENIDALALHLQLQNLDRARLKTHEIDRKSVV